MKNTPYLAKLSILFVFFLLIQSCSKNDDNGGSQDDDQIGTTDDDPNVPNTVPSIIELAQSVNVLSDLVDALDTADPDLVDALSSDGQFTVFAPTNDAFDQLLSELEDFDTLNDFDEAMEKELLAEILKYHVISGAIAFSPDLSDNDVLETVLGETVSITIDASVFINDKTDDMAEVVGADNDASNGVVHIINKVLLPQSVLDKLFPKPSIVELVVETENLSLLEEAVLKAGLETDLGAEGPFTLFAPTNEAIEELFELLGDSFNSFDDFDNFLELQILEQILRYHIVPAALESKDLTPGTLSTLLPNETIQIIASGDTFVIGDASDENANLVELDQMAGNGIIHSIDKILVPQEVQDFLETINPGDPGSGIPDIKEIVEGTEELAFLREALELTGLLETLGEEGPFTVFAPTNNTISLLFGLIGGSTNSIDEFDLDFEIELLRQVLSYHVVPGIISSNDLMVGDLSTLLLDSSIEVGSQEGSFFLRDDLGQKVNFGMTDIPAGNGIIHTVDRILIPQVVIDTLLTEVEQTMIALLYELEDHDMVISALIMARDHLEAVLETDEFTFFLPTNRAFLTSFDSLEGIDSLLDFDTEEELELLGTILAYHFVPETTALSNSLTNGAELITFQGETLNIINDNSIQVLDKTGMPAIITLADQQLFGGVIHVVNKVLIPSEV